MSGVEVTGDGYGPAGYPVAGDRVPEAEPLERGAARVFPAQSRSRSRLEHLRSVARRLYNDPRVGRDRLTTSMLAEASGSSIGTVYRYYADRIAILDDIAPDRDQSPIQE